MSGIVGVFNCDGRPIGDDRLVRRMLDAIAFRGPDASHVWTDGPIALGHCLLRTTPESVEEQQPHHLRQFGLSIVFDGRLDNREELFERFDRARIRPAASFDAAYVLCAYRLWGSECPARLLGDFAFAIWDARRRQLFCARDVIGLKPFYYHGSPGVFLFASEPQALLRHPAVSCRPNEGMVGEYLSVVTSLEETLFADIRRLPPASGLSVSLRDHRLHKYWQIDARREIRYATTDEYCEQLRSLLQAAVRARLRSRSTVGVMLSGGVDSSSILATAASLVRRGGVDTDCEAFSMASPAGVLDEMPFIDQVVAMYGCRAYKFAGDLPPVSEYRRASRERADVPSAPHARLAQTLARFAGESGVRVLLSGVWSDEWFGGSYDHCADLFRSLRWVSLIATVQTQARFPDVPLPGPILKVMTWPLLPIRLRKRIKMLVGRDGVPRWIRPEFARKIALPDRLDPLDEGPRFPTVAQRSIYREATSGTQTLSSENQNRVAAKLGVELAYPFADRRVVEFAMAIPEDLRWKAGIRKFILREAMRHYLPDEIRRRLTSADAAAVFVPPLRGLADQGLLSASAVEKRGWVHAGEWSAVHHDMLARYTNGDDTYKDAIWPLWSIAAVEIWMQEVIENNAIQEDTCEEMMTSA